MSARKYILALAVLLADPLPASPLQGEGQSPFPTVSTPFPARERLGEGLPADTIPDGKPRYSVRKTSAGDTKDLM